VPLDVVTTHAYTGKNTNINDVDAVLDVLKLAAADAAPLPLVITEMGSSYVPGRVNETTGTCHDTFEAASFLARLYHEAARDVPGLALLSYWAISDVFEEGGMPAVNSSFSGDFGLINIYGSSWFLVHV
jgi:beta-xylosidase